MTAASNSEKKKNAKLEFADGYFSSRILAGDKPDYGYPANHLPDVGDKEIELKTSFVEGRSDKE